MANAIQNALRRKRELERELQEIDQFLALHDRFSTPRQDPLADGFAASIAAHNRGVSAALHGKTRGRPSEFADLMERILLDAGRPMQRNELVEALEKRGFTVPSEDKARYVGTILWRNRRKFVNMVGVGYALRAGMPESEVAFHELRALVSGEDGNNDRDPDVL